MKVTALETIHIDEFPNLLWVHLHTDEGLVGLGETFFGIRAAEAHIHEVIAPYLIGKDPRRIDLHSAKMVGYLGFHGSSAEQRARSAVDIALWDLWGKTAGQPVCQMLGGAVRDDIRIYNTCAGNRYAIENPVHGTHNFGLDAKPQQYEDLHAFLNDAGELAQSLLEMGITGMKIWPFDFAAEASNGSYISAAELDTALEPFRKIRAAVGDQMDVMAELHGLWNLQSAKKLCAALEEFNPLWIEDPVFLDQLDSIGQVQASTSAMIGTGEILGGRGQFLELFQNGGCGMAITDLSWCGGISEARKIGTMAEAFHINVAFHDCTGPVVLAASTHLALNARNCFIQEMVRAYYYNWYGTLVTALPPIKDGRITVTDAPGLGLELNAARLKAKDVQVRRSGK